MKSTALSFVVAVITATPAFSQDNVIVNGDFENPELPPWNLQLGWYETLCTWDPDPSCFFGFEHEIDEYDDDPVDFDPDSEFPGVDAGDYGFLLRSSGDVINWSGNFGQRSSVSESLIPPGTECEWGMDLFHRGPSDIYMELFLNGLRLPDPENPISTIPTSSTDVFEHTHLGGTWLADYSSHGSYEGEIEFSFYFSMGVIDLYVDNVYVTCASPEEMLVETLQAAIEAVDGLDLQSFKNRNMQKALTNKLGAMLAQVDEGLYEDVLDKLIQDVAAKMDGCAESGEPDKNDWLTDCEAQGDLGEYLLDAVELLSALLDS